ncbi:MAG: hypothetical protein E7557_06925 [Ruminococcaceae bacterium]|nr:hypothetical protein [Oscillospiraceae bacterium]
MNYYGPSETWKIVYYPKDMSGGQMGVALIEADSHQQAMFTFQQQYAGEFRTVAKCEKLIK